MEEVDMYCGEKEVRVKKMKRIRAVGYRTGHRTSWAKSKIKTQGLCSNIVKYFKIAAEH